VDASDQITSTDTDLDTVTMTDKHVVHRNLHLVALGAEPQIKPAGFMALNFNNPYERDAVFDIAFDRANFPGRITLLLRKLSELSSAGPALDGFKVHTTRDHRQLNIFLVTDLPVAPLAMGQGH
jgi:hypothetical protein